MPSLKITPPEGISDSSSNLSPGAIRPAIICACEWRLINGSRTTKNKWGSCRLMLESLMPSGGLIFSDGIESDYVQFDSGSNATVAAAAQKAHLIVQDTP